MTDWRKRGWCDVCEWTLGNGDDGDGVVCPECGFDSSKSERTLPECIVLGED